MNKLWDLIKTTLIEKDGNTPVYGSIKRWAAWILLSLVVIVVIAGELPGGSLTWAWCGLKLAWNHKDCNMDVLKALLTAIGTYILTGQLLSNVTDTIQNYHGLNAPPKPPDAPKA